ncbi:MULTISPECIES: hypothetical protein [Kitasatospora]|uniref:hypothetical protein n=2 Tax=Kitasatospora albolonga TaxID=68173 RepID=UPI0035ECB265
MRKITALAALTMAGLSLAAPAAHAGSNMGGKLDSGKSASASTSASETCVQQIGGIPLLGKNASAAAPLCSAGTAVPK